jgi:hypothetical protein
VSYDQSFLEVKDNFVEVYGKYEVKYNSLSQHQWPMPRAVPERMEAQCKTKKIGPSMQLLAIEKWSFILYLLSGWW